MALVASRRSVMNLFSSATCPQSHRVRVVLAEKGITVEIIDDSLTLDGLRLVFEMNREH